MISQITPDYKIIYTDIINKKYPHKAIECSSILEKKELSVIDIIELNQKIFGTDIESFNRKYRSYSRQDILHILNYQKRYNLNDSQLANHFKLSRNSVAKWKKIFQV